MAAVSLADAFVLQDEIRETNFARQNSRDNKLNHKHFFNESTTEKLIFTIYDPKKHEQRGKSFKNSSGYSNPVKHMRSNHPWVLAWNDLNACAIKISVDIPMNPDDERDDPLV